MVTSNQSLSSFLILFAILFIYNCFFLISIFTHWSSDTTTSFFYCSLILQYTTIQSHGHFYPSLIFLYFLKYILTQSSSILHSFLPFSAETLFHIFSTSSFPCLHSIQSVSSFQISICSSWSSSISRNHISQSKPLSLHSNFIPNLTLLIINILLQLKRPKRIHNAPTSFLIIPVIIIPFQFHNYFSFFPLSYSFFHDIKIFLIIPSSFSLRDSRFTNILFSFPSIGRFPVNHSFSAQTHSFT